MRQPLRQNIHRASTLLLCLALLFVSSASWADARTQAKRMHDRIAGVPPTEAVLADMAIDIGNGNILDAANTAMDNPNFYNVTLKNFVTPWTNREQTVFAPLNDYTATVIGLIRDDVPFTQVLSADVLYVGGAGLGLPVVSPANNNHYAEMENDRVDLSDPLNLVASTQTGNGYYSDTGATAGIMTTRAAGEAFFIAGTNRAMFRYTSINFLCRDLEQLKDVTRIPDRIRQDVTRSPGGDSRLFMNTCVGCHSGMDALAGAFAYYNYNETSGRVEYTADTVHPKHLINASNFEHGYVTTDDSWLNYWRQGPNSLLGWDTNHSGLPTSGNGAKSLGVELAQSEAFAQCQVQKVFQVTCLRAPSSAADRNEIDRIVGVFKTNSYSMKRVFAETAGYCRGD